MRSPSSKHLVKLEVDLVIGMVTTVASSEELLQAAGIHMHLFVARCSQVSVTRLSRINIIITISVRYCSM
jgi:hypothetical protein